MDKQTEALKLALEDVYLTIIQWDVGGGKRSRRELARRIVALADHFPGATKMVELAQQQEPVLCGYLDKRGYRVAADFVSVPGYKSMELWQQAYYQPVYTFPLVSKPWVGLVEAINWVKKRRDDFINAHGSTDPDTGTLEFGSGRHAEAKVEYVGELEEIIEGLSDLEAKLREKNA